MLSVIIPTYHREKVLCDTITSLLGLPDSYYELLVMDQTPDYEPETVTALTKWNENEQIRWIKLLKPSITGSMNRGALEAKGAIVLFLDDDIIPSKNLIKAHRNTHEMNPDAWVVVGQVLQPKDWNQKSGGFDELKRGKEPDVGTIAGLGTQNVCLKQDLDFQFNGSNPRYVTNVMAGNLSVKRDKFIEVGGFDENFFPPVSYRFETEFARRIIKKGGKIRFAPKASIRHLRASSGGTRSQGSHLTSISPIHGVGDYYYALRCGKGWDKWLYICKRPFREVRTKFHLKHPWWIPVKLVGEIRAFFQAVQLNRKGPKLIDTKRQGLFSKCIK